MFDIFRYKKAQPRGKFKVKRSSREKDTFRGKFVSYMYISNIVVQMFLRLN